MSKETNVIVESLSRVKCLGLHDNNDPEEPGQEYRKSIVETDENIMHILDDDQNSADQFHIYTQQYILDKNNADKTHASSKNTNSLPHTCYLDPQK